MCKTRAIWIHTLSIKLPLRIIFTTRAVRTSESSQQQAQGSGTQGYPVLLGKVPYAQLGRNKDSETYRPPVFYEELSESAESLEDDEWFRNAAFPACNTCLQQRRYCVPK